MLLGEYEHTIDDKNRLTLPARFREPFADGVVVTRGMDGCLFAYTRGDWDSLVSSRLATLDPLSKEGRRMQRFFFSGAAEAELDKQGRVWDRDAWRRELAEVEGSAEDVAERLAAQRD
jgi:MraZ protein